MKAAGYQVENTKGEKNLDDNYMGYAQKEVDCVTAFEIFEHMLAPYNILKNIKSERLIASVPLKLWFASAYWNEADDWDKHYHEFEIKQFKFLLEKAGWTIKDQELWTSPDPKKDWHSSLVTLFYAPLLHRVLQTQLVIPFFKVLLFFVINALSDKKNEKDQGNTANYHSHHFIVTAVP